MEFIFEPEFWVAVSFFLFLGLALYLGVHKKLTTALDARSASIAKELDEARRLREEAQSVLADYRTKQSSVDSEVAAIVSLAAVAAAESIIAAKLTPEAAAKLVGTSIDALKSKLN